MLELFDRNNISLLGSNNGYDENTIIGTIKCAGGGGGNGAKKFKSQSVRNFQTFSRVGRTLTRETGVITYDNIRVYGR